MLVIVALSTLVSMALSFMVVTSSGYSEQRNSRERMRAFYVAEGGLREAVAIFTEGGRTAFDQLTYPKNSQGTAISTICVANTSAR